MIPLSHNTPQRAATLRAGNWRKPRAHNVVADGVEDWFARSVTQQPKMPTGEERAEAKRLWQVAKVISGEMQTKDIGASAGVSYTVVSSRLRKLEAMGVVTRRSGLHNTSFWQLRAGG